MSLQLQPLAIIERQPRVESLTRHQRCGKCGHYRVLHSEGRVCELCGCERHRQPNRRRSVFVELEDIEQ